MFIRHGFITDCGGASLLFFLFLTAGCAGMSSKPSAPAPVTLGQSVQVDYTCMLTGGELAATTSAETAGSSAIARASIFAAPEQYGPVPMTAGEAAECTECDRDRRHFRLVLEETIQKQLIGLQPGRKTTMAVTTDELLMDGQEGRIKIRRHQSRLRVKPFEGRQLEEMLGRPPVQGETVKPAGSAVLPFKVLEVKGPAVLVEFQVDPARPFPTPFGAAAITAMDDKEFRITINPDIGHLVRSGGLIGRVAAVDEEYITLDYRHPFGYEELLCEVTVAEAAPGQGRHAMLSGTGR
jgi:FKBP-type peptidyl-prolyl cis-trans isomerase 2